MCLEPLIILAVVNFNCNMHNEETLEILSSSTADNDSSDKSPPRPIINPLDLTERMFFMPDGDSAQCL